MSNPGLPISFLNTIYIIRCGF